MQFNGPFHSSCQGQWNPMNFQCAITGTANNFQLVLKKKPAIADIPQIQFKGNLLISKNKNLLKGSLSSGVQSNIQFQTSLHKNYKTTFKGLVDFSDVQYIYGFGIEGVSQISQGSLSFSKNQFALKTSLKADSFLLDGWRIGNLKTRMLISNRGLNFQKSKEN